jgi:diacylglycerol kinase (ATP)
MIDQEHPVSEFKSKGGWQRILGAWINSIAGMQQAWRNEHAFRQELFLAVPACVVAFMLPLAALEKLLLIGVLVLVLIMELINSAIEAVVDRVSLERHPLSKDAKDFGSAAVLLSLLLALGTWAVVVWPLLAALR